jgi:cysteine desulfurase
MDRIYLDHAATTPLLPEAAEAMAPWLARDHGNPSSLHAEGRKAKAALDEAREALAKALNCEFGEVVFTSSGTEAANLAILGAALANANPSRSKVVLGGAEHHCVLHTRPLLERLGYRVELAPVDREARVRLEGLEALLDESVLLVSVMHANNELGTVQPADEVCALARECRALFHCDAAQTFLKLPLPDADVLSVSAHKVYGPKGVGALRVRAGVRLRPLSVGGGQERELRAGTENVAGIVGFGESVRRLSDRLFRYEGARRARDRFMGALRSADPAPIFSVPDSKGVLSSHAHLRFPGLGAESMLIALDRLGVAASSGAACSSGSLEPSHVMLACGYSQAEAKEGLRFTFGKDSTMSQAEEAAKRVLQAAVQVRGDGRRGKARPASVSSPRS